MVGKIAGVLKKDGLKNCQLHTGDRNSAYIFTTGMLFNASANVMCIMLQAAFNVSIGSQLEFRHLSALGTKHQAFEQISYQPIFRTTSTFYIKLKPRLNFFVICRRD